MIAKRTIANAVTFLVVSTVLIVLGVTQYLLPSAKERTVRIEVSNAAGLLPRSDVTVRGVPSGFVQEVVLTEEGTAVLSVALDPDITITEDTVAVITRRSPIGDLTVELVPGEGSPLADGGTIPMENTIQPPEAERTIQVLSDVLEAVPPEDLGDLVSELATGLRGRGDDLGRLSVSSADLSERILEVRRELASLFTRSPEVLDVLATNVKALGDDITQTALLADILRDRRFDLVELSRNSADLGEVLGGLLADEKANIACLIDDFGSINSFLISAPHLGNLKATLDLNHFFFDGVEQSVRRGKDGLDWFRVHFLAPQEPPGLPHTPHRPPPDVYAADACRSRFGTGVGPGTQPYRSPLVHGSKLHPGR